MPLSRFPREWRPESIGDAVKVADFGTLEYEPKKARDDAGTWPARKKAIVPLGNSAPTLVF
jgi:hypothetical protein